MCSPSGALVQRLKLYNNGNTVFRGRPIDVAECKKCTLKYCVINSLAVINCRVQWPHEHVVLRIGGGTHRYFCCCFFYQYPLRVIMFSTRKEMFAAYTHSVDDSILVGGLHRCVLVGRDSRMLYDHFHSFFPVVHICTVSTLWTLTQIWKL